MNFVRSRLSIGSLLGQRSKLVSETWSHRGMCTKPQEAKATPPAAPAKAPDPVFKIPGIKPTPFERKIFVWSGHFKTADQIPEFVTASTLHAAKNKARVKVCYIMMAVTVVACAVVIYRGKRDRTAAWKKFQAEQNTGNPIWRQELQKDREAVSLSEKAQ